MLHLYNSASSEKELFVPIDPSNVRMYVCGPTVYSWAHLGNARSAVAFDVIYRVLLHLYPRVTFVRNITDIDDKIIEQARANNESIDSLTARTYQAYSEDMALLGVRSPTHEPRARQFVQQMQDMIKTLITKKHAYVKDQHVLFSVESNHNARLSGHSFEKLRAGARVEVAEYKNNAADFVLWKPSKAGEPGWSSPWGWGRPGWHIECSAMAAEHLGDVFDIHGGGHDLLFPHHENETAQSTCAHGTSKMANYWLHNGMLTVDGKKMSKSAGNFLTVREILSGWGKPEAVRFVLMSSHYRQNLDFTQSRVKEAEQVLSGFYRALQPFLTQDQADYPAPPSFMQTLLDDINTPLALAWLHTKVHELQRENSINKKILAQNIIAAGKLLGLFSMSAEQWFQDQNTRNPDQGYDQDWIELQIEKRGLARLQKDFKLADQIRNELLQEGIQLQDGAEKTLWIRV